MSIDLERVHRIRTCEGDIRVCYWYPNSRQGEAFHSFPIITSTHDHRRHNQDGMIKEDSFVELARGGGCLSKFPGRKFRVLSKSSPVAGV